MLSNFVIGWNNLAPIFQPIREGPRVHGQVCPVGKRAFVNEAYIKENSIIRKMEKRENYTSTANCCLMLAVFLLLPSPRPNVCLLN